MSRRGSGRRSRPFGLRDAVILSIPVVVALGYAVTASVLDYRHFRDYDDWWANGRQASSQLRARLRTAALLPRFTAVRDRLEPALDDAQAIRIVVDQDEWDASMVDGSRRWADATLVREGDNQAVDVRRRGDTSVHWTTPKKSFTVRARRGSEVRGTRTLALTGKTVLESQVAALVTEEFGLLAPRSTLTPVYLNEQYYGLFRALEPIDESFLRKNGRMPGNIYRADTAERGEYFKNIPRNVFWNPYIWDRVAELNVPTDDPGVRLRQLLDAVNGQTLESHLRLDRLVDRDEIARLLAASLLVGDPYHMSGVHNQFWYDDPATGVMHPIPWDLRLLDLSSPADIPLNDFYVAILRDPRLADGVLRTLERAFSAGLVDRLQSTVDSLASRFEQHLQVEDMRAGLVSPPGDPALAGARLRRNADLLSERLNDARIGFAADRLAPGRPLVLDIVVHGWAGVDLSSLIVSGGDEAVQLWADTDLDGRLSTGDSRLTAVTDGEGRVVLDEPWPLLSGWGVENGQIVNESVPYRLFVQGAGLSEVRLEVVNRITGGPVEIASLEPDVALGGYSGFHPWSLPVPTSEEFRLQGDTTLENDLRIGPDDTLIIDPGTTIRLGPDVSILSMGRVEARGTAERPIRFMALDTDAPWGAMALQGAGASGSRFEHVEFSRGGGAEIDGVSYKGMVSAYAATDVRFRHVRFLDNLRSDDAFNAVYAEAYLEHCVFANANGDAVDYDYSTGAISHCVFEASRNDAIDLMSSSPLIRSNVMTGSGDKGVSIGEASEPILIDNHIIDADRGLEIKDRSDPLILHNTIERSNIGLLSQVKNWRYAGGGRGRLLSNRFESNGVDLSLDPESAISELAADGPLPRWAQEAFGVNGADPSPGTLGLPPDELEIPLPAHSIRFNREATFDETAYDWSSVGAVRLRVRESALHGAVERGSASWERQIDWNIASDGDVTVEFTGRDLRDARLVLVSERSEVSVALDPPVRTDRIGFATGRVPAGRYSILRFEAAADPRAVRIDPETGLGERRGGRLDVTRIQLFEIGGDR